MSIISSRNASQKRHLLESGVVAISLTSLSYFIALLAGWLSFAALNWIEVFAVATSYACTYLCVKERRINYPIGALSTAAYAILFFQSGLYLSAILNLYLVPTLIYGWFRWRKDEHTRPVTHLRVRMIPVYLLITLAGYLGAVLISSAFGGAMAWTDAVILACTILAQFLLDNKKLETWIVWAIVNVFAIYTYANAGLALAAVQYVLFLANTTYGYITWRRSMHDESIRTNDRNATDNRTFTTDTVRS